MKKVVIRIVIAVLIGSGFLLVESKVVDDENKYDYIEIYYTQSKIEENEPIRSSHIKKIALPKRYIYSNYIESNVKIIGSVARNNIESGTMLSHYMLKEENDSYPIEPNDSNNRLITIKFDEVHSNGYMIQKNQLIDLVYISNDDLTQGCTRLENIEIREILTEDLDSFMGKIGDSNHSYIYVCFEVTKAIDEFLIKELPSGDVHISIRKNQ